MLKKTLPLCVIFFAAAMLAACQPKPDYNFQGYVEGELLYLSSPFSGTLQLLNVSIGQTIEKGALVFKLDSEPESSQLNAANQTLAEAKANLQNALAGQRETILASIEEQINKAQADLNLANIRVQRLQTLYKTNAIDKDSVDAAVTLAQGDAAILKQLQANLAEAKLGTRQQLIQAQQAAVDAAKANVQQADWALSQKTLAAPTNAVVFDRYYWPGEWVAQGQPVVSLLAPQYIRFIFYVPETMLSKIYLNEKINISCDSCNKEYPATIDYISPNAEYTPPVIYSRDNNYNLVYRIKAVPEIADALLFHPGQPVYVTLINPRNTP